MTESFDKWCESVKDCGHTVQPNSATARQRKLGWDAAMAAIAAMDMHKKPDNLNTPGEHAQSLELSGTLNLLPCPFCQQPALYEEPDYPEPRFSLGCSNPACAANCMFVRFSMSNKERCVREWNNRVTPREIPVNSHNIIDAIQKGMAKGNLFIADKRDKGEFMPIDIELAAKAEFIYQALPRREAVDQWQPIETAPKDRYGAAGLILVCWENSEMYPVISRWLKNAKAWSMPFNKPVTPPTHWMELPKHSPLPQAPVREYGNETDTPALDEIIKDLRKINHDCSHSCEISRDKIGITCMKAVKFLRVLFQSSELWEESHKEIISLLKRWQDTLTDSHTTAELADLSQETEKFTNNEIEGGKS